MSDGQNKSLHPFFGKSQVPVAKPPPTVESDTSPGADPTSSQLEPPPLADSNSGRKTRSRRAQEKPATSPSLDAAETTTTTRRKRRKLSPADHVFVPHQGSEDMVPQPSSPASLPSSHPGNSHPTRAHHDEENHPDTASAPLKVTHGTPPKKMIRLSAGGTLVSPSSKPSPAKEEAQNKKKRGRPKKEHKKLVAVLRYTPNHDLGLRLGRIIDGSETFALPKPPPIAPPPKPKVPRSGPSKPTHPFFSGKSRDSAPASAVKGVPDNKAAHILSPRRPSAVTPGKLRAQARECGSKNLDNFSNFPQFGANRDRSIIRQPGMVDAPFPSKGCAHVRGSFYHLANHVQQEETKNIPRSTRKMKYKIPLLDPSESVLTRAEHDLDFNQKDVPRSDGFYDPPSSLRVPRRHLVPGSWAQNWIGTQLQARPSADEIQSVPHSDQHVIHPACERLFKEIPNTLTPFDQGRSEVQAWAQKYSPQSAAQVLQPGKEATYLRDWMKALTISAVESAGSQAIKHDKAERERGPKKKRRKKTAELDDFIVNDDDIYSDAAEYLVELSNDCPIRRGHKPSLVRNINFGDQSNRSRIANSIILSGPAGCGKTAMVHAAAKELGFEIFELNPGSRRSGKDVLDRIGDMVENHLVQNRSIDTGNTSADEDAGRLSDAFNKDLESGRQGTMKSFFTSKPKAASQPKQKENKTPKLNVEQVQKVLSSTKPSRGQKQSLILLEEVDIMFEEDKNFWSTIFTLLHSSKRPIVVTCNDEDLVPLQAIQSQAILRLSAPPRESAVDYLLLIAAQEGHLLHREAISTLYNAKRHDLRASIAELQLWCQMGVGDPRGGLSWIFPRWPVGSGLDEHGQPIRVFSEDTYQPGMGFLVHETSSFLDDAQEDELLKQIWTDWNIDPRERLFTEITSSFTGLKGPNLESQTDLLKRYSSLSDSLSDMDVFCQVGLPGEQNRTIDATQPELSAKSRLSYINGMALLQTPEVVDYNALDTQIGVSCCRLARRAFSDYSNTSTTSHASRVIESLTSDFVPQQITRVDFSSAFDAIATVMTTLTSGPPSLSYSVLDGPLKTVVTEVAPYIRSIAAYDRALETQRWKLQGSSQSSASGSGVCSKRLRTTRAARSALEGGQRQLTRRERWFDPNFDLDLALQTAGDWPRVENAIAESRLHSPEVDVMRMDA